MPADPTSRRVAYGRDEDYRRVSESLILVHYDTHLQRYSRIASPRNSNCSLCLKRSFSDHLSARSNSNLRSRFAELESSLISGLLSPQFEAVSLSCAASTVLKAE